LEWLVVEALEDHGAVVHGGVVGGVEGVVMNGGGVGEGAAEERAEVFGAGEGDGAVGFG
jgi:hypothetical protein